MIFLNERGEEIDRLTGYYPPERFLEELKRINAGTNTFMSLKWTVENEPENAEAIRMLAEKYSAMNRPEPALTMWYKLKDLRDEKYGHLAEFRIISMESSRDRSAAKLLDFMEVNKNSPYYVEAIRSALGILSKTGLKTEEARLYQEYVFIKEKSGEVTYSLLNGYAWRMTELELQLEDALEKALQAVELVKDENLDTQAQVIDTLAEVYWKLGQTEKAVETIRTAIALQPEDKYYKEQLEKFSG